MGKIHRIRTDRKLIPCRFCGKSLNSDNMKLHIKSKHSGQIEVEPPANRILAYVKSLNKRTADIQNECVVKKLKTEVSTLPTQVPSGSDAEGLDAIGSLLSCVLSSLQFERSAPEVQRIISSNESHIVKFRLLCENTELFRYKDNMRNSPEFEAGLLQEIKSKVRVISVPSDGNCFYSSVSLQAFGTIRHRHAIRVVLLHEIFTHYENLEGIITLFRTDMSDLIKTVKTIGVWANEAVLFITSEIFRRPIFVIQTHRLNSTASLNSIYHSHKNEMERLPLIVQLKASHFQPLMLIGSVVPDIEAVNYYTTVSWKYQKETNAMVTPMDTYSTRLFGPSAETIPNERRESVDSHLPENKIGNPCEPEFEFNTEHLNESGEGASDVLSTEESESSESCVEGGESDAGEIDSRTSKELSFTDAQPDFQHQLTQIQALVENIHYIVRGKPEMEKIRCGTMKDCFIANQMNSAKTVTEVLLSFPEIQLECTTSTVTPSLTYICSICYNPIASVSRGVFRVQPRTDQLDLTNSFENLSGDFRNFKKHVKRHLQSKHHKRMQTQLDQKSENAKTIQNRNLTAGMICGRMAYMAIKVDANILKYEKYMAIENANGRDVGDLNHGEDFCRKFSKSVHHCLKQRLESILNSPLAATGKPPPVAVIADKYTPNRSTVQIVGLVTFLNGKLDVVVIDLVPVQDHSAMGLASSIIEPIVEVFGDTALTRLVDFAVDGEYHVKRVIQKIFGSTLLNVLPGARPWFSAQWDPAHLIELAFTSAKLGKKRLSSGLFAQQANSSKSLLGDLFVTVTSVNSTYAYGKRYDAVKTSSEGSLKVPAGFSSTRFAAYNHKVLLNFLNNYQFFYDDMNSMQDSDLGTINTLSFVILLHIGIDIMKIISTISLTCQKVELLPWQVYRYISTSVENLRHLVECMNTRKYKESQELMYFKEAFEHFKLQELTNQGFTFQNKHVVMRNSRHPFLRSKAAPSDGLPSTLATICSDSLARMKVFVLDFVNDLEFRVRQNKPTILDTAEQIFAIENVTQAQASGLVTPKLWEYAQMAKLSGNLESTITRDKIEEQYLRFANVITNLIEDASVEYVRPELEYNMYCKVCATNETSDIPDILHLLLTTMVRTHCESAAESIGSVVKFHAEGRSVKLETLRNEVFVHWNGPEPEISDALIADAMDLHFSRNKSQGWNFHRVSPFSRLKAFFVSQVVDRIL